MSVLPEELLDQIIDHVAVDANSNNALTRGIRHDIATCALASRVLRERCQRHLFRTIFLDSDNHDHLRQWREIIGHSPQIATFVVELTLTLKLKVDADLVESKKLAAILNPALLPLSSLETLNIEQLESDRAFLYCFPIAIRPLKTLNIRGRFLARPGPLFGTFLAYFPKISCLTVEDFVWARRPPPPSFRHFESDTDTLVKRFILRGTRTDPIWWDSLAFQRHFRDLESVEMSEYDCESLIGLSLATDAFEFFSSLKVTSSKIKGHPPSGKCEYLMNWLQHLDVSLTSPGHVDDTALWWIRTMAGYDLTKMKSILLNFEAVPGGVFYNSKMWHFLYYALESKKCLQTIRIHASCLTDDEKEGESLGQLIISACERLGKNKNFTVRITNVAQSMTFFTWPSASGEH